jgi:tetratricopeptide (TPR) repeat protein
MSKNLFLVGAGISLAPPSQLPSGADFDVMMCDLLTETGPVFLKNTVLAKLRQTIAGQLRLETFLETLASEISPHVIFQLFAILRPAEANFAHLALVTLSPRAIITANQDLLLERAASLLKRKPDIIHLHGRCDRIETIVTLISQYIGGLDRRILQRFRCLASGADITVLGYSGRDRDIMPALLAAKPKSITWIRHRGSELHPELERAQRVLGPRLRIVHTDTTAWLRRRLSADRCRDMDEIVRGLPENPVEVSSAMRNSYRRIGVVRRNRAIAKVLEHIGWYREARHVYLQLRTQAHVAGPRMLLDLGWVNGRITGFDGDVPRRYYARARRYPGASPAVRAQALVGEADTLRNTSKPFEALARIEKVEALLPKLKRNKRYWHLRGWSLNARAGIARIEGYPSEALVFYRAAERALSKARDISGHIETLTWQAECALLLGQNKSALAIAEDAVLDAVGYGKYLVRNWPSFVKAEALAQSGDFPQALEIIDELKRTFEAVANHQGSVWSRVLESDCLRERSWRDAAAAVRDARRRMGKRRLAHVEARLLLEDAEIARARRDWKGVASALTNLRAQLRNKVHFTSPPALLLAHALLVEAECARQRRQANALSLLKAARQAYNSIGARAFVMRVDVALYLAGWSKRSRAALMRESRREGYRLELARLKALKSEFYPIHFV